MLMHMLPCKRRTREQNKTHRFPTKTHQSFVHQSYGSSAAMWHLKTDLNPVLCLLENGYTTFLNTKFNFRMINF